MADPKVVKVERRGSYQGTPTYGITGQSEITTSRATAKKWAALENAANKKWAALKNAKETT